FVYTNSGQLRFVLFKPIKHWNGRLARYRRRRTRGRRPHAPAAVSDHKVTEGRDRGYTPRKSKHGFTGWRLRCRKGREGASRRPHFRNRAEVPATLGRIWTGCAKQPMAAQ